MTGPYSGDDIPRVRAKLKRCCIMAPGLQRFPARERGTITMKQNSILTVLLGAVVAATACSRAVPTETPAGVQVPAASQKAFGEAYGKMRNKISQANVARDPMDYFPPNRLPCSLDLFVTPGEGVAFDQATVNDRRTCQGKLFFYIPGGVQPGRYVLGIDLQEDEIRIPF